MRRGPIALLLFALVALSPSGARADDPAPPSDVSLARFEADALPDAPDGFVQREDRAGDGSVVRWDHPASTASLVDTLASTLRAEWPRIERELGADVDDGLVIRVARSPEEMAALAPPEAPPPAYAVGVAYPASGLVLLTLSAPETWERPDVVQVLTHELSHVALHRAAGGRPVPRWLSEGLAIHQAGERSFERVQTLWDATVRGTLIPLDDLSRSFPARPHQVSIAYAESADFVEWLRRRGDDGDRRIAELIGRLARGQDFEVAVSQTWSAGIGQLEHEWRAGLAERYGAMPLLLGTGVIWGLIAVLVVLAWLRRRRDARAKLASWAELEDAEDAAPIAGARPVGVARSAPAASRLAPAPAPSASGRAAEVADDDEQDGDLAAEGEDDDVPLDDLGARARPRGDATDPHVPKVVWDGRSHTLH